MSKAPQLQEPMDLANWMSKTPGVLAKPLWKLVLPESHDAGTYDVSGGLVPSFADPTWDKVVEYLDAEGLGHFLGPLVKAFTQAQSLPILQQLRAGVRVLDLRVCWLEDAFYIHHGPIVCGPLQEVLSDIASFLAETERELVVAVASHFAFGDYPGGEAAACEALATCVVSALGDTRLVPRPEAPMETLRTVPLSSLMATRSQALVVFELPSSTPSVASPLVWFPDPIEGSYADSTDLAVMESREQSFLEAHAQSPEQSLFQLQWLLTPDADFVIRTVIAALASGAGSLSGVLVYLDAHGLTALAAEAHGALGPFLARNAGQPINCLRVDECAGSPAVGWAISLSAAS